MKQIVSNYSYSPTTNVVTLTGVNIEQDQLLLVVAPQVGRTMYNFASGVTGVVSAGANTQVTLNASTAGLTTTSPLVIFYDDQASTQTVAGAVTANVPLNTDGYSGVTGVRIIGAGFDGGLRVQGINPQTFNAENLEEGGAIPVMTYDNQALSISGTVTANLPYSSLNPLGVSIWNDSNQLMGGDVPMVVGGVVTVAGTTEFRFLQVSTQGSASVFGTVTVGNTVTIGSLPAISGTVTARLQDASGNNLTSTSIGGVQRLNVSLASAATPGGSIPSFVNVYGGSDSGTVRAVAVDSSGKSVVTVSNFPSSTTVTVSNFPATQQVSGTVTANTGLSQPLTDTQLRASSVPVSGPLTDTQLRATAVPVSGTFWQATQPVSIASVTIGNSITIGSFSTSVTARLINPAGTAVTYAEIGTAGNPSIDVLSIQGVTSGTAVPVSISSVTIGAVPNGALTTRFGSVTTANTAQISSAVTNASRKYLFIQNVTTSSNVITIGIGFTPTTTQGIQLSAGGGITFESSYIPTGAVYILSSVTASPFTILEA